MTGVNRNDPNYSEDTVLNAEYKAFFEDGKIENDSENIGNPLYQLQVLNNLPVQSGMFFSYRKKCELCDKDHKDNCEFAKDNDKVTLRKIYNEMDDRDLVLVAHWRSQP